MQKLYSVSEAVTKDVYTNGDAGSRFDGRKNARVAVMFLDDARLLFHRREDGQKIIVIDWITLTRQSDERFTHRVGKWNAAATRKRMIRRNGKTDTFVK